MISNTTPLPSLFLCISPDCLSPLNSLLHYLAARFTVNQSAIPCPINFCSRENVFKPSIYILHYVSFAIGLHSVLTRTGSSCNRACLDAYPHTAASFSDLRCSSTVSLHSFLQEETTNGNHCCCRRVRNGRENLHSQRTSPAQEYPYE